jgi:sorbitol/mannitol transport system substrate-binding protein
MAFLSTMVNTFGGQWFDMSWKPQLESKPWKDAITFYVDLLKKYGPPGLVGQQLQRDPGAVQRRQVRHVDRRDDCRLLHHRSEAVQGGRQGGLRARRRRRHAQGRQLAVGLGAGHPAGTKKVEAAQKFITWATSKDYINLVGKEKGWARCRPAPARDLRERRVPEGGRFAEAEKKAIDSANPNDSTLPKSPYVGVQFAAIPEFQAIGIAVGQQMSARWPARPRLTRR